MTWLRIGAKVRAQSAGIDDAVLDLFFIRLASNSRLSSVLNFDPVPALIYGSTRAIVYGRGSALDCNPGLGSNYHSDQLITKEHKL
ncbi:hypothetical protein EVAR_82104_1 [Eumeta japonica]|uniref:Uncharacterized protein n=1 Tax=Eumeta variegata TaxID=151549 RepID=A0A4C1U1P6_EUMVA|nr:hypothetical protein EVAR_82104_1 [Eumeta japonica]